MVKDFVETRFLSGSCCKRYVNVRACSNKKASIWVCAVAEIQHEHGIEYDSMTDSYFFLKSPFLLSLQRRKQPLKLTPWSQPRHLFTTLYLDVSIPALGAHTRQRKRMDHLWRWRFVVYGYQMILDDMDIDGWNRW